MSRWHACTIVVCVVAAAPTDTLQQKVVVDALYRLRDVIARKEDEGVQYVLRCSF
jgi:hypothetical protein